MISAFRARGEHTTGTARAGMWQRSRGPFAIDIPEIKLGFTCSGHAPGSKEEELGSRDPGIQTLPFPLQALLLLRVREENASFNTKEGYQPLWSTAVLRTGEFQERGEGRKAAGSGRIPAPNPCKHLCLFLGGLLCFLHH